MREHHGVDHTREGHAQGTNADVVGGLLLVVLGLWSGLIPLIGPSFDYGFRPDETCTLTEGRLYLSLLPGLTVAAGGFLVMLGGNLAARLMGALLALAGGAWLVMGTEMSRLWNDGRPQLGDPIDGGGGTLERLTFFQGAGALIIAVAAVLLGRLLAPQAPKEPPRRRPGSYGPDAQARGTARGEGEPLWPPGQFVDRG